MKNTENNQTDRDSDLSASAGSVAFAPIGLASAARIYVMASDEYCKAGNDETSKNLEESSRRLERAAMMYAAQNK